MEKNLLVGLLALTFCICLFLAWFFTHQARHKERRLMIEKGMNPDTHLGSEKRWFKIGIVVIGLGLGLGIIGLLTEVNALGHSDTIPLSILGLSGGAAMLIANRLAKTEN